MVDDGTGDEAHGGRRRREVPMTFYAEPAAQGDRRRAWETPLERRALALWPRLGRDALRRCGHDPRRIAALISRRTSLDVEAILGLLAGPSVTDDEVATWFG
jgi:hypothetical protein